MARTLPRGVVQTHYGLDMADNIARTAAFVREAAGKGAQVVLPSELFQGPTSAGLRRSAGSRPPIPGASIPA